MALPAMAGFREHGEEIHDVGPRTTRVRLDVHDPGASARHRDAGEFDDEPGQVAGPQSGPGPTTVDGVRRVQISAWECGDGLEHGPTVTHQEIEVGLSAKDFAGPANTLYHGEDLAAPPASGSHRFRALVVVPCSGTTLAKIATGIADNLVTRAAAVALKERRPLVLVPRETPLSAIVLENLLKLARLGVVVLPASHGFYGWPHRGRRRGSRHPSLRGPSAGWRGARDRGLSDGPRRGPGWRSGRSAPS